MRKINTIADLATLRDRIRKDQAKEKTLLTVCGGTGCQASKCKAVVNAVRKELKAQRLTKRVRLRVTGCHGFCEQGPLMVIDPSNTFYCRLTPGDVKEIVSKTVRKGEVLERLLYTEPATGDRVLRETDIPFYSAQDRMLLSQNRLVDPCEIEDYIAIGGYAGLSQALAEMTPNQVIKVVTASGLRGRGGGGYPTGRKWATCREAPGGEKYVICNADEGDPGAYMDRSILEGNPHAVLEGMIIGAVAVGAEQGYIYVRNEYPLAVEHARVAVKQARKGGLLGKNILGTDFSFDVEIVRGGGAFVCGESTALMVSLEGKVGEPRAKDVHTVLSGLWDKPTVLNNVETWANVPPIVKNGAAWFRAKGTRRSKGTKIFALTGQVKNTGLVEVEMGASLEKIVFDIGGGSNNGKGVKAVQTGGPSGGCLPVSKFGLPVDFDTLVKSGSMMGSGGMVVMDEGTCMVDVAKYFLTFLQDESCGKCTSCRIGISRMLEIVTDISEGRGRPEQIPLLEELAETVSETSLCGLGKSAPNPVISTLKYFRREYTEHIRKKTCPAAVCKELIEYEIEAAKCDGCGRCVIECPHDAVQGEKKQVHNINVELCHKCGICASGCKSGAVVAH
jgi:NADH-quinone oxidoreductase subunit F